MILYFIILQKLEKPNMYLNTNHAIYSHMKKTRVQYSQTNLFKVYSQEYLKKKQQVIIF